MRAFLGIFPPEEIISEFRSYKQDLRKQKQNLRFVPAPDIHLSLKFLGPDVSDESIAGVIDVCRNLFSQYKPIEVELSYVHFGFEREAKPRVLFASIKQNPKLENVVSDIEAAIPRLKFPDTYPPRGKYIPHFTLARIHGNIHWKKINEIRDAISQRPFMGKGMKFTADTIKLVNSIKTKDGQRYEVVEKFKLSTVD